MKNFTIWEKASFVLCGLGTALVIALFTAIAAGY